MNVKIYSLIAIIGTNCSLFLQTKAADADLPKGGIETGERTEKSVTIMNVVDLIRRQGLKVNLEMVAGVPAKQVALGKDFISYKNLFQTAVKKLVQRNA